MVEILQAPRESSPLLDIILILIMTGFAITAVVFTTSSFFNALIPLICTILFFVCYLANKGVIGGQ
ncbi:MAG: hypothetical protein HZB92_01230 [Euryarchaeota archaeon]|nr:hypothetical protein [Euryarchaeota archaeon]